MCSGCVFLGDNYQVGVWRKFGFFTERGFVGVLVWVKQLVLLFYTHIVHLFLHNPKLCFSSFASIFSTLYPTLSTKPTLLNKTFINYPGRNST
jgi:hypothetical protein